MLRPDAADLIIIIQSFQQAQAVSPSFALRIAQPHSPSVTSQLKREKKNSATADLAGRAKRPLNTNTLKDDKRPE